MSIKRVLTTTATLLATLAFVAPAAADDCDKATRESVLKDLVAGSWVQLEPPPGTTHVELTVKKNVIYLETVWDADLDTVVLKGERFPFVKFKLDGIACRRMNGTMGGKYKEKAQGVLSEDHREMLFSFNPYGATHIDSDEPAVTKVRLVRR